MADDALPMFGRSDYTCGLSDAVLTEATAAASLRRIAAPGGFQARGRTAGPAMPFIIDRCLNLQKADPSHSRLHGNDNGTCRRFERPFFFTRLSNTNELQLLAHPCITLCQPVYYGTVFILRKG
ncbi:hypothetical protein [Sterolibacterium denitrificans]|uniref:hypothetical protein n=1 Tax=Sterolibacterium denitrificans TaxID=157592 RepID=UPI001562DEDC|nr:hypothetical protein [Sterolibacterium denitrificans]